MPRSCSSRRCPSDLRFDRRGIVALEFALVCAPFLAIVIGIMEITYGFYAQEVLDMATQSAARQIQIGSLQASAQKPADFLHQAICDATAGLLPCAAISANVQVVSDYATVTVGAVPSKSGQFTASGFTVCAGKAGQLVLMQTYYPMTVFLTALIPFSTLGFNGGSVHVVTSAAAFMNEQFPVAGATAPGC